MRNPDQRQLAAFANLSQLPDWKVLDEFLEGERTLAHEQLEVAPDDVGLRRYQGRAIALKEIRDLVNTAQATLQKMRKLP